MVMMRVTSLLDQKYLEYISRIGIINKNQTINQQMKQSKNTQTNKRKGIKLSWKARYIINAK
jgi:hypothetical protein